MVNTRDAGYPRSPITEKLSDCNTIQYLVEAMRRHDPALIEHGMRTASYALVLGWLANLRGDDLKDLYHAGLLHDLGKLSLPDEVIRQDGVSIIGDYLMTECTPRSSTDMLRPWPALQNVSTLIALHHERWDGTGIPCGLRGNQIPLGARILSLADTVDQLLTQKSNAFSAQATALVRILRTLSGARFDPKLVKLFVEWFQDVFLETLVHYPWLEGAPVSGSCPTFTTATIEPTKLVYDAI